MLHDVNAEKDWKGPVPSESFLSSKKMFEHPLDQNYFHIHEEELAAIQDLLSLQNTVSLHKVKYGLFCENCYYFLPNHNRCSQRTTR